MNLKNKNCLVTGATRGIGHAIAKTLAEAGANVYICGRSAQAVERVANEMTAETGNKVKGKAADVSSYEAVEDLFQSIHADLGPLDVLVNNAGVGVFGAIGELSVERWKAALETNLYGTFYCVRQALPGFETRGGGHIVQIGSLAGAHAFAGGAAYNASKFGVSGFTEAIMQDLRMKNVRVSHVMPGSVATGFGSSRVETDFGSSRAATDFGGGADSSAADGQGSERRGPEAAGKDWKVWPEDVAETVRFLLQMPERTLISRIEVRPSRPKR
jgi:NADP-dependent 3-hydroxy acid dehydrogenase YdfG